jgi:tetratricopeptide (TPR) repeat protein
VAEILRLNKQTELNSGDASANERPGVIKLESIKPRSAILDLSRAIASDPYNATNYYQRAIVRFDLGDNRRALVDLDRAIELSPDYAIAYYSRACIKCDTFDLPGCITDLTRAAELYAARGQQMLSARILNYATNLAGH